MMQMFPATAAPNHDRTGFLGLGPASLLKRCGIQIRQKRQLAILANPLVFSWQN
jgi:hypothetical protein